MTHRRTWIGLAGIGLVALGLMTQASAQWTTAGGDTGRTAASGPGGGQMIRMDVDPNAMKAWQEQYRIQQAKQLQDALGATDDEWKALEPKIDNVQKSWADVSSGMPILMGYGQRLTMVRMGADANTPKSDVQKTAEDLKKLLDDKDSSANDIKAALAAYRDARVKAKAALDKAREDLKSVLTVRQEAVLVARGTLE